MQHASPSHPLVDLAGLSPYLGQTCSGYLGGYQEKFEAAVRKGEAGVLTAQRHCQALDGLLSALYCAADAATRKTGTLPKGRIALVAVGGYGRGLLGLHSDVDVLFLCDDPEDPFVGALAEGLLYPLWDLGVTIGHVVRGVEETLRLSREDIRTATTLIDLRRVAGDRQIIEELEAEGRKQVFEPAIANFVDALQADTKARHGRFGGSLYVLEPEVKQGRGGLRDMDVAEWVARARWGAESTRDYIRVGALLEREVQELEDAREMLWRVRNLLHLRAKRQHDRLTFADQEEIAVELGFVDGISLAVEQFMQAYYRHAMIVAITAERMIARARPTSSERPANVHKLGDGTVVVDDMIAIEDTERLMDDPALSFRFYRQALRHHKVPDYLARDAIARICPDSSWRLRLQGSEEANQVFLSLIKRLPDTPFRLGSTLLELHEVGLLVAMIPEFESVVGRVHHDAYHIYTTDVHAIYALDYLRKLAGGQETSLALAARLASEAPRKLPLMLAVLLHSIGKPRAKHYEPHSVKIARSVLTRLGLAPEDIEHVGWLIKEHWTLYHWATRRDVHDEAALRELAKKIGSLERLRDLYLVTVAIVSTVNPDAMTSWKMRSLEDLYLAIVSLLGRRDSLIGVEDRVVSVKLQAMIGFVGDSGQEELQAFMDEMPERYFLANPVDVVRRHARAARDRGEGSAIVHVAPGPSEELDEIVVITEDRPGLLSDVTAVLSANRLSVVAAEIYTRVRPSGNEAFDIFWVRAGNLDEGMIKTLKDDLHARLQDRISAAELVARTKSLPSWAVRKGPEVKTQVHIDNGVSSFFTVVDVFSKDTTGLLHEIARTFHEAGVSIRLSKINTEGDRVVDVFYVEDEHGRKIVDEMRVKSLRKSLVDALAALHKADAAS